MPPHGASATACLLAPPPVPVAIVRRPRRFTPTLLTSGTLDLLLSDTARAHRALRAAGVDADLHVWEAGSHGGVLQMASENAERTTEVRRFTERCWS